MLATASPVGNGRPMPNARRECNSLKMGSKKGPESAKSTQSVSSRGKTGQIDLTRADTSGHTSCFRGNSGRPGDDSTIRSGP
jgi:hypothetical protein